MKFPKISTTTVVSVLLALAVAGYGLRFFGDKPILSDIKKGLNGDSVGLFN